MLDTLRDVETPEGVALQLRCAGVVPRALAWLLDLMVRVAGVAAISTMLGLLGGAGVGAGMVMMFLVYWGYPIVFEVWRDGQTPGKRAFGLKVVSDNGTPVTWLPSVVRNLLRTVDMLPALYGFGAAASLADRSGRRLGDHVAGTVVIYAERAPVRPPAPVAAPQRPPLPLQLDEQRAIIAYAERAPQMTPERQAELAELLEPVTGQRGSGAVSAVLGMANYLLGAAMKQEAFIALYEPEWGLLEEWLQLRGAARAGARKPHEAARLDDLDFPARYRRVCQQLALAQRRGYSARVLERLEALAQRGHDVLYRPPAPRWQRLLGYFATDYPRLVRRHARFVWLSAALFFLPLLAMLVLLQFRPELVHSVFETAQLREIERMYDPASPSNALGRESGTNLQMFGYYIFNNISIGFRTFASGLLFGVGAIVVLVTNGIVIGTVAGHLTAIGYGDPFWRFVAGHSGFELSAIVLAGGAGLRIGWALLAPGRLSRRRALVEAGKDGAQIVYGVFVLLVLAAFVEAFWSSIGWMPSSVKFSVGGLVWIAVWYWLWRGGRDAA